MLDHHFVFLDLETTGAAAARDRITEIGLVEVAAGRCVGEWSTLVNPGVPIPPIIQSLTGLTDDMVADAPRFETIAADLARRLEGKVLAAHNARFDYGFLHSEFSRAGMQFSAPVVCTVKLSRRLYPQHRRHNLDTLMERHNVSCSARHRALGDARVLWDLAQTWMQEIEAETLSAAIARVLKSHASPADLPDDLTVDDIPETPGVYTFYGDDGGALYVGRGANLRTAVLSRLAGERGRLLAVKRVDWTETAGELGALMHEARRVAALTPAHNRRGREPEAACAWRWSPRTPEAAPELIELSAGLAQVLGSLHGVFRSRAAATAALRELALKHELCFVASGLEDTQGACYGRQVNRCRGACIGRESRAQHALRLGEALARLTTARWPYAGPVAVREENDERCELHVIDRWCYLGSARNEAEVHELLAASREPEFDLTTYRILTRFLGSGRTRANVMLLATPASYRSSSTAS